MMRSLQLAVLIAGWMICFASISPAYSVLDGELLHSGVDLPSEGGHTVQLKKRDPLPIASELDEALEELGLDMCPERECKILPVGKHGAFGTEKMEHVHSEKRDPLPVTGELDEDLEGLGVDACPEMEFKVLPVGKHEALGTETVLGEETVLADVEESQVGRQELCAEKHLRKLEKLAQQQEDQVAQLRSLVAAMGDAVSKLSDTVIDLTAQEKVRVEGYAECLDLNEAESGHSPKSVDVELPRRMPSIVAGRAEGETPLRGTEHLHQDDTAALDSQSLRQKFGGRTIARYKPAWSDHFHFLSAVKVDSNVSCLHVLLHEGEDGISRYVAVGDESGQVYLFLAYGDLLLHHQTLSTSPITSMLSYVLRTNETVLITGHSDGSVLMHRICETLYRGPSSGDEWHALSMEDMYSLVSPPSIPVSPSLGTMYGEKVIVNEDEGSDAAGGAKASGKEQAAAGNRVPVTNIEMYRVGKIRYLLVSDVGGKLQVFRENGSLHGVAHSPSRPLAFLRTPNTQRLLFLTETGAGSLDLMNMTVRSSFCEGLNDSKVVAYTFDAGGRSKAYGFTVDGDLIYVALSGDTFHFKCQVGTKKALDVERPLVPHAIKGYLLVATPKYLYVYNTTSQVGFSYANIRAGGTRPVVTSSMDEVSLSFVNTPVEQIQWPVMTGNRDKLVVVGFGDGYVGIYISNLPVQRPPDFNAKLWSSPIFFSILLMFVGWLYFSKKRDFGLENQADPMFGTGAAPATPGTLKYENIRAGSGEPREALERRRFSSPVRGMAPPSQSSYGAPGSLSFRTTGTEASSYSARREPLFSSTKPVGDLRH